MTRVEKRIFKTTWSRYLLNTLATAALITVLQLHLDMPPGDILVFLTGQEEIESLSLLLQEKVKLLPKDADPLLVLPALSRQR